VADENVRLLDTTDTTQVIEALQSWINGLSILDGHLWLEYIEDDQGLGYCIKANGGAITDEDILGNFTAEVLFIIYYTVGVIPDGAGMIYKPLNDLAAWFKANGTTGLSIGDRRTPSEIKALKSPTDLSGKDEDGSTTFFAVYQLTYDEEAVL